MKPSSPFLFLTKSNVQNISGNHFTKWPICNIKIKKKYCYVKNDYVKVVTRVANSNSILMLLSALWSIFSNFQHSAHCFGFNGPQFYCFGSLSLVLSAGFSGAGGICLKKKITLRCLPSNKRQNKKVSM